MQAHPLCKITFSISEEPHSQQQNRASSQSFFSHSIPVIPGMSTYQIAEIVGNNLGCGYVQEIQSQICSQLRNILSSYQPKSSSENYFNCLGQQQTWRSQMKKVLQTCDIQHKNDHQDSIVSQKRNVHKNYFQFNYDKFFQCQTDKIINLNSNKQNIYNIYQRSLLKKKETDKKISLFKQIKKQQQTQECTFIPNINNTIELLNKKKQKDKQSSLNSPFERLYKQSFDLREKKKHRIRTLQNQQEAKLSQCSFFPVINQCSRQICRIKSHASIISELSDEKDNKKLQVSTNKHTDKKKLIFRTKINDQDFHKKSTQNENTEKKRDIKYTFQPQLSQNTKKMTKDIPNFFERLSSSKQKFSEKKISKKQIQSLQGAKRGDQQIKLKKQIYTIEDDVNQQSDYLQTQKKQKSSQFMKKKVNYSLKQTENQTSKQQNQVDGLKHSTQKVLQDINDVIQINEQLEDTSKMKHIQKRSHELFNNRKITIFQTIFSYLSHQPPVSINQFSKIHPKQKQTKHINQKKFDIFEVGQNNIQDNPYLPIFIKEILNPISSQLNQLNVSLNKQDSLMDYHMRIGVVFQDGVQSFYLIRLNDLYVFFIIFMNFNFQFPISKMQEIKKYINCQDKCEIQKNNFFHQVYRVCQSTFSIKQFQFFIKCIIPHRLVHNKNPGNDTKPLNTQQKQQQKVDLINLINPNILSMPRKFNFYQEKNIEQVIIQKKNRRILTTPTERMKKQLKFDHFQDFSFFKKIKMQSQNLTMLKTNSRLNNKKQNQVQLYPPQSLFYPSNKNQIPKTIAKFSPKTLRRSKTRGQFRNRCFNSSRNQIINFQLIPQRFIEVLKISNNTMPLTKAAYHKTNVK